jgi:hypothetical protein
MDAEASLGRAPLHLGDEAIGPGEATLNCIDVILQ